MAPVKATRKWEICNLTDTAVHINRGPHTVLLESNQTLSYNADKSHFGTRSLTVKSPESGGSFVAKIPRNFLASAQWIELELEAAEAGSAPWKLYHYSPDSLTQGLMVMPSRNMSSWMSGIGDAVHLSNIMMPGTHDSMALSGWPLAQCQNSSMNVLAQLQAGIRVLDVRLGVAAGNILTAYHGIINETTLFSDVCATLYAFLQSYPGQSECVVVSIKQEDFATVSPTLFQSLVHQQIFGAGLLSELEGAGVTKVTTGGRPLPPPSQDRLLSTQSVSSMWYLRNEVPTLGQVRGKIILFSRFGDGTGWDGGLNGMGIHPTTWPDSPSQTWTWGCGDTTFRCQDWYNIGNVSQAQAKFKLASSSLITYPSTLDPKSNLGHILPVSFSSASSIPLALPGMVATGLGVSTVGYVGVNNQIASWALSILGAAGNPLALQEAIASVQYPDNTSTPHTEASAPPKLQRVSGWLMMDYFDQPAGIPALLVELNYVDQGYGVQMTGDPAASGVRSSLWQRAFSLWK